MKLYDCKKQLGEKMDKTVQNMEFYLELCKKKLLKLLK